MDTPRRSNRIAASPPGGARPPRHPSRPDKGAREERDSSQGFLKSLWSEIQEDDVFNLAAGIAFFAFLSFPPTFLVLFALAGFFGGPDVADRITGELGVLLPEEAETLVQGFVNDVVYQEAPGPFSVGLLLALWAASNVFMALTRALNTAYDIDASRSWVKQRALSIGVMLLFVILFLSGSVVLITGPQIAQALNLWGVAEFAWTVLQWPLAILLVVAAFWMCYYILPARDQAAYKVEIFKGALVATLLWLLATIVFRFYIGNFGSYSATYGIIGTIIVLLLWLYITGLVLLLGGELSSELEKRARG